jgi:hypothetical protein
MKVTKNTNHIIDSKNQISASRYSQLKTFFTNKKDTYSNALQNMITSLQPNNKPVKVPLKKAIQWYLLNLSKKELDQLRSLINKVSIILDDMEKYDKTLQKITKNIPNDKFSMLISPNHYPLKDVLFNYLYYFTLLPHYKNQLQFNTDLR